MTLLFFPRIQMNNLPAALISTVRPTLCFLFVALLTSGTGCVSKKEPRDPASILGSWRWVKSWNPSGALMTPDSTCQRLVVTFRADSTYNIAYDDSLTARQVRYFTAAAKVYCRPDTVVQVIWYDGLDGHQIIELSGKDTLMLIGLDHQRRQENIYSLYYRDKL